MIENLTDLEKSLHLPDGSLDKAIKSADAVKIVLPELIILTKSDDDARINNLKTEFKTAGLEIGVKEARTKYGLDFTGKTIDNFAEALKTKILSEAKIEPDKKVTEITNDLNIMRSNFDKATKDFNDLKVSFIAKENERKINDSVFSKIPENTTITKEDIATIFKSKYKMDLADNGSIVFKNGGDEILKNQTTLNPLTMDEVMTQFISPYIKPASGGAGAGDAAGAGKAGTLEAFGKEMIDKGVKENTQAFNLEMSKRIKDGTLKL